MAIARHSRAFTRLVLTLHPPSPSAAPHCFQILAFLHIQLFPLPLYSLPVTPFLPEETLFNHLCLLPEWLACCCVMPWVPFTTLISISCIVTLIHHFSLLLNASWVGTVSVLLTSLPITPNRVPGTWYKTQVFVQRMVADWVVIYSSGRNLIVLG